MTKTARPDITREEAESILNMMKFSEAEHSNGSIAVLKKLKNAYPDLINGTPFESAIAVADRIAESNKNVPIWG